MGSADSQCSGLAGNEGSGTGLGKLWVTEAWPLTSMQELQGEAGGGPRGAEACRLDRQPCAGGQALRLGVVASNPEQPTEDLSGTLNLRGRPARTRAPGHGWDLRVA